MGELILPNKEVGTRYNKHHVFFEARHYKTHLEQTFRCAGGLVLPLTVEWHNDLHANVKPPQKPSIGLMRDMLDLSRMDGNDFVKFSRITDFLIRQAETAKPQRADEAHAIATNLLLQQAFIDKGAVQGGQDDNIPVW